MSRRIKVFEVLECGSPHGVGRQVAAICRSVNRERFELWVVYAARPGCNAEEFEGMIPEAHRLVHIPEMVREISPRKDASAFWKLYRLMRREKPDVVHAHSSKAGVLARLAAKMAGVPRIYYSPHGYGFLQTDVGPFSRGLYWFCEWAVSWIGHVVSTATGEARRARRLSWGKKVHVVHNLFLMEDAPATEAPAQSETVTLGALGRITHARNPEAFVRMAKSLSKRYPHARFLWIGGGESEGSLRAEASAQGLSDRLEVTGHIPRRELLKRLGRVDIFIHYSLWEGSPTSILEAMFFAKPVIASRISGNDDLVLHGVTGFLAADEQELLRCASRLIESPELRSSMGKMGKERLTREFAPDKSVAALETLYQDL